MSFRLVPQSVTLNDLERCNSPNGCVFSPHSVAFGADYVNVVEDTPIPLHYITCILKYFKCPKLIETAKAVSIYLGHLGYFLRQNIGQRM